jgi:hypothetical protein
MGIGNNKLPRVPPEGFANGLAIILTFGTIAVIIFLVATHQITVLQNQETFKEIFNKITSRAPNSSESAKDLFESFQNYYREANASNTNLLSILLPVIGAWVGAILAFYYGAKSFERMSRLKATSISPEEDKLAQITIGEVLEKMPEYKDVIMARMSDRVGDSYKKISEKSTNIVLIDENGHPLGIIYKTDFTRNSNRTEQQIMEEQRTFQQFFTEMNVTDLIKDERWTENGVENYAEILKNDTLLDARAKMQGISQKPAVSVLVLDEGKKILGVVTYELFSNAIKLQSMGKMGTED